MEAYFTIRHEIAQRFEEFELTRITRGENTSADAIAALASASNPRIIPVEGIENPIISLPPPRGHDSPAIKLSPQFKFITTLSIARRAVRDRKGR